MTGLRCLFVVRLRALHVPYGRLDRSTDMTDMDDANRLTTELERLYGFPALAPRERGLVGADGRVRAAVVEIARAGDWSLAASLCHSVQAEMGLPAPAVSIAGGGGYRLWFSFSEALAVDQARSFLIGLCKLSLGEWQPDQLAFWPEQNGLRQLILPPAQDKASGKWSAFIDPELGSLFVDEPGLDMAPSEARQADLLAGVESIPRDAFERALARLGVSAEVGHLASTTETPGAAFTDPKSFLLAVMNDPAASLEHRIEAAKALLPWFERDPRR